LFESSWIAIIRRSDQKIGLGSSGRYQISNKIVRELKKKDEELATIAERLSGQAEVGSGMGMMGLLTRGALPRDVASSHGVIFAFAPLLSDKVFWS
jgi:non-canonical (house-cleaning) NTP pyrophosphatase